MKEIFLKLNQKQKIILLITSILILFSLFIYIYKKLYETEKESEILLNNNANEIQNIQDDEKIQINNEKENVMVHVIGEVNSPGVVKLEEGARIIDAIQAAGGKTEEADLSKVNLAYVIEDGTQIYIPRINENLNQVELISEEAGHSIIVTNTKTQDNENQQNSKVNINTANKEKLETLPGIGETTAQKIIDYREQNGKFNKIEDLKNVSGIGEAKFNSLKDKITV